MLTFFYLDKKFKEKMGDDTVKPYVQPNISKETKHNLIYKPPEEGASVTRTTASVLRSDNIFPRTVAATISNNVPYHRTSGARFCPNGQILGKGEQITLILCIYGMGNYIFLISIKYTSYKYFFAVTFGQASNLHVQNKKECDMNDTGITEGKIKDI